MNDYMTSKDRLIFLDSKHKRTDRMFKRVLLISALVAIGILAYEILAGAL